MEEYIVEDKTPSLTEKHHAHVAPILGVLLIILVLVVGGLYLWGAALTKEGAPIERVVENNEPETPRAQADAQILNTVSSSDSLGALEADIMSTNLDSLDAELTAMENELTAGLSE